jgi:hypothetical protein
VKGATVFRAFLFAFSVNCVFAQAQPGAPADVKRAKLYSPWEFVEGKPRNSESLIGRSCLDLITLEQRCGSFEGVSYGNRFGVNWDIFHVHNIGESQTRIVDLGKLDWAADFEVPAIQPWSRLRPGESRNISVNVSGADGQDGAPGMNGDGTYTPAESRGVKREGFADKPIDKQVSAARKTESGSVYSEKYMPFIEVKKGHIYAVRVVDPTHDYYVLIRVDDLVRGTEASISFKKVDGPTRKPVL